MALRFPAFASETISRPEWAFADPMAFTAWVKLCVACGNYENGGEFGGAVTWDDGQWLMIARVTKGGVDAAVAAKLCIWRGDTLVVNGYEVESEQKVQRRRSIGKVNGKNGGRPKRVLVSDGKPVTKTGRKRHLISSHYITDHSIPNGIESKPAAPAAPTAQDFIAGFVEARKAFYAGETYRPTPRDAGAAKQLASNHAELLAEWAVICRRYFACGKEFYRTERHPLSLLVSGLNAFTGEVKGPDPPNGKRRDVSVGHFAAPGPEFKYPSGDQEL